MAYTRSPDKEVKGRITLVQKDLSLRDAIRLIIKALESFGRNQPRPIAAVGPLVAKLQRELRKKQPSVDRAIDPERQHKGRGHGESWTQLQLIFHWLVVEGWDLSWSEIYDLLTCTDAAQQRNLRRLWQQHRDQMEKEYAQNILVPQLMEDMGNCNSDSNCPGH